MRVSTLMPLLAALHSTYATLTMPNITNTTALPKHYAILVFPTFQALDVFGPLDVLNTLAMLFNTTMHLSVLSATMDPVTTVPQRTPRMNMTHGDFGESIVPTNTFKEVLAKSGSCPERTAGHGGHSMNGTDKGDIEVLIVPGGGGTREPRLEEIDFVKQTYPKVKYILSVCTGATILSRAGILDGRKATTNKRSWKWATSTGPKVDWVPTARWVQDGNIWSSSGISAGIDLTYAWVAHVYGEEVANYVSASSEYVRWRNSTEDPFAKIWDVSA
ncbi:class I glutamine amidotransferase-like protein [Zopfia rhizophila CBS 207.26]|uniref:Class I glutamine amidotransferase-like protein n=1 Tax=Zopfia rhizophila CBS 207.26 TaxID=1314779 RepID=A0A6A6DCN0_9PEZI|nr:class I glutamine amidotransferase-like protein [Zopfia rhizophila CBS 207.26]